MNLASLKPELLILLFSLQAVPAPKPSPEHFRYRRTITIPASVTISPVAQKTDSQVCAVLDAAVFAHSGPSLRDVRLYSGQTTIPYATTLSEPLQQESANARILNLGLRAGHVVFDLEMPRRPYTSVALDLAGQDFIATAVVSGSTDLASPNATSLGTFTLFDLTRQNLSRRSVISIAESSFAYLHVDLAFAPAPGSRASASALNQTSILRGAAVPPSREAQTLYTTVEQTSDFVQRGRETVGTFHAPLRVPVERVAFVMNAAAKGNFSRSVKVTAHGDAGKRAAEDADTDASEDVATEDETAEGTIHRVHATESGKEIADELLTIPAVLGSNMQRPATIEVAVENGDDAPLPFAAMQLQMRQRRICFEAPASGAAVLLAYGDPQLESPVYDYARLLQSTSVAAVAQLGPEQTNPDFVARSEARPFTERHPELLWVVLLAVVCILALTAIRSAKRMPQ